MFSFIILCVTTMILCQVSLCEEQTCKRLHECPLALSNFKLSFADPKYCDDHDELVECPEEELDKSKRKCLEYMSSVFEESDEDEEYIDKCKITAIPFVYGGTNAFPGEFPHIAAIGHRDENRFVKLFCGGSILTSQHIITSAYCVTLIEVNLVRVGPRDYRIEENIVHPNFEKGRYYHDIAIAKLVKEIKFSPVIRPICLPLPQTEIASDEKLTAVGWNSDDDRVLQKVELEQFTFEECRDLYEGQKGLESGVSSTTHLCYGDKEGKNKDTCDGDAGGPLLKHNDEVYCSYILIGITSAGIGCRSNYPGLYTNIIPYLEWIESIIWN